MNGGPLGKYSQLVAALTAVGVILAAIAGRFVGVSDTFIDNMALIAMGAIFGASASTAITNGAFRRDLDAIHKRLDNDNAPPASRTGGTGSDWSSSQ